MLNLDVHHKKQFPDFGKLTFFPGSFGTVHRADWHGSVCFLLALFIDKL